MRALSSPLRKTLETAVLAARRSAESASRAALDSLAVFADPPPAHLSAEQRALGEGLRAKWRQLGDDRELLVGECAYEQWHRLLFARFLAENDLLLHPTFKAPVTLAECADLAAELGEPDGWSVAARFASEILPGIFRLDDPCVLLRLAPEGRDALERIVAGLPAEVFTADDGLGWVYQFWQKDKKDEINKSERKIGGADIGPVTQLFTENYMVRFLLENSLGAWWASRHPDSPLVKDFEYLRFDDDGKPAAGSFDGWPERVAEVTMMDPCCGSGHFLVEGFGMLWRMRAEEEGLTPVEAQDAVLRDNLFGLEIDQRCVQIAMFAVALAAWKAGGGWRGLPVPNVACSGIPARAPQDDWTSVAHGSELLEGALLRLHGIFRDADALGSLIDPRHMAEHVNADHRQRSFDDVDWERIAPLLQDAASLERGDPATAVLGASAVGLARAADFLARSYVLVGTNVPYLTTSSQSPLLRDYLRRSHPDACSDLATACIDRCLSMCRAGGCVCTVSPEGWLFLSSYERLRRRLLHMTTWHLESRLGPGSFGSIGGEVVRPTLTVLTNRPPTASDRIVTQDLRAITGILQKSRALVCGVTTSVLQSSLLDNPRSVVTGTALGGSNLLHKHAYCYQGLSTGDNSQFVRAFWEVQSNPQVWRKMMSSPSASTQFGGRTSVVRWDEGCGQLHQHKGAALRGRQAWGHHGVVVGRMGTLPSSLYLGELFDDSTGVIVPYVAESIAPLWAYLSSPEFEADVRHLDTSIKVTNQTLVNVPFDLEHWRGIAEQAGPLPDAHSDDPTQWLFTGLPESSTSPLQVATARLLGYRWPDQPESDDLEALADRDGIVCLPSVSGESPAADRLQRLLAHAFGVTWSPAKSQELLEQAGSRKRNLADWLRDEFFKQHCALFANRPFVWHIWDGQLDGFSALVNYHRLDRKALEKLTYTYLGQDWVERQRSGVRDETAGAEARLSAALGLQRKLEAILEGEAPYDIFVRWKPLNQQPLGWEPDLNDGVRLNVRPFVEAGVLRAPFNVHWKKDRGKNADGSERLNDLHFTLAEKRAARGGGV